MTNTNSTDADCPDDPDLEMRTFIDRSTSHTRYQDVPNMWQKRTIFEKSLLVLVTTTFLVAVVSTLVVVLHSTGSRVHESKFSTEGVNKFIRVVEAMDLSVDPCADFYAYSCNGWIKAHPIPETEPSWDPLMKVDEQNRLLIKHALEQPGNLKSEAERKAKMFYESCLDIDTIEQLGAKPLLNLVRKLGGWNITKGGFDPRNWSLQNSMQLVQNTYNTGALFSYAVVYEEDLKYVLRIEKCKHTLPTPDHYQGHSKVREAYLDYMTTVGVLLGGEPNSTRKQMDDVLTLESKLENITRSEEVRSFPTTIGELNHGSSKFLDWRAFFENAANASSVENLTIFIPTFLHDISLLIEEYQNTTKGNTTLNNYLVWQTVRHFSGMLSKGFRDAQTKVSSGSGKPRWNYCVEKTIKFFDLAVGSIFVREVVDPKSKIQAEAIINNVCDAFKANVAHLEWMDEDTRKMAIVKANTTSHAIGYRGLDPEQLDKRYEHLEIRNDAYFNNSLNIMVHNLKRDLGKIGKPVGNARPVRAYFINEANKMVYHAGILQSPVFDPTFPPSLNYGGMGFIIGHELTHGFDDGGRMFDKDGNAKDWWTNETIAQFANRSKCLVKQDSEYLNVSESVADAGGLKAAYHAYLSLMKDKPEPLSYPDLPLNHKQAFFVAFAQTFCPSIKKGAAASEVELDKHSPGQLRVVGALRNFKEFGDVFQCTSGSKMNPQNKCDVW